MTRRPHGLPVSERIRTRLIIPAPRYRDDICRRRLAWERLRGDLQAFEASVVIVAVREV